MAFAKSRNVVAFLLALTVMVAYDHYLALSVGLHLAILTGHQAFVSTYLYLQPHADGLPVFIVDDLARDTVMFRDVGALPLAAVLAVLAVPSLARWMERRRRQAALRDPERNAMDHQNPPPERAFDAFLLAVFACWGLTHSLLNWLNEPARSALYLAWYLALAAFLIVPFLLDVRKRNDSKRAEV
ncbi:hypothetical protein [Paraburkholderia dilworthii]|uniref:Uncharacterized protein n=1 Tax=Paraburkholderia dilworthii TaxID=948106 RepID=A0ABW9D779_9BURK